MTVIHSEFKPPLTPAVFHILLALVGGERHGYAIMQDVDRLTGGVVQLGPGTLYGTLKRLLTAGLIEDAGERADAEPPGERRRCYRLTDAGGTLVRAEAERLERVVVASRRVLSARDGGSPA